MRKVTLNQMITEVDYELRQRKNVYARLAASGKERQSILDFHTENMEAVGRCLRWLRDNEALIREVQARGNNGSLEPTDELLP
jgi:hypothetical protein